MHCRDLWSIRVGVRAWLSVIKLLGFLECGVVGSMSGRVVVSCSLERILVRDDCWEPLWF